jgi:hypothetical protein
VGWWDLAVTTTSVTATATTMSAPDRGYHHSP